MDTHLPQYASSPRAIMWARSVQVQVRQSPTVRREGAPTAANAHAHREGKEISSADALRLFHSFLGLCDLSWPPIPQRA
jgi:hypothetical protein